MVSNFKPGKTTLVNHVLREKHGRKIAVVENEFGEVKGNGNEQKKKNGLGNVFFSTLQTADYIAIRCAPRPCSQVSIDDALVVDQLSTNETIITMDNG